MNTGLKDKAVCITGGSAGIGLAAARAFLDEGCRVAICGRSRERLSQAAVALGGGERVYAAPCDVTHAGALAGFAGDAARALGGIDVWVNNAGTSRAAPLLECSEEDWAALLELNVTALWRACRAAAPYLRERGGGAIVNVSSYASLVPTAGIGLYALTKSAVNVITRTLAAELCGDGIRVNGVAPGMTETQLVQRQSRQLRREGADESVVAAYQAARLAAIPMGRYAQPEEIAAAIVFLAGSQASYITGETLTVAGGKGIVQNPAYSRQKREE